MRLSIETYPGIRSTHVILPSIVLGNATIVTILLLTRLPYDRLALVAGFVAHILWAYGLYLSVHRLIRHRIAIVPFGDVDRLKQIDSVDWRVMREPTLADAAFCDGLVADFTASDMPPEWEGLMADAAVHGRMVYQVKQLRESLTGRVEIDHLSENSFGSLVLARAYFHLKSAADLALALALLPLLLPVMGGIALAIKLDSRGPVLFRQRRVRAGEPFHMLKFGTMVHRPSSGEIEEVITADEDPRITWVGGRLRASRLDELPQIFNIIMGQKSWIGPRPEAGSLSSWYTGEIPFYRYRHVVWPGISRWAQANQGHVASVDEVNAKLQYDFYYVK